MIDKELFEKLCNLHCTKEEIASVLFTTEEKIEEWCMKTYNKPFEEAIKNIPYQKISLRRTKWIKEAKEQTFVPCLHKSPVLGQEEPQHVLWISKNIFCYEEPTEQKENELLDALKELFKREEKQEKDDSLQ